MSNEFGAHGTSWECAAVENVSNQSTRLPERSTGLWGFPQVDGVFSTASRTTVVENVENA